MNELIREIEEDIKRERWEALWHSFGKVIIGISIGVIALTVVVVLTQNHKQALAMQKTSRFIEGVDRLNIEDYKSAITIFSELADPSSPYYGLAMLRKAQAEKALLQQGAAAKTYNALAQHDAVFGGLASMLNLSPSEAVPQPAAGAPFYYLQSELRAWQWLQQDKKDDAVNQFFGLYTDHSGPPSQHGRLNEVLRYIAPEQLSKAKADEKDHHKESVHE